MTVLDKICADKRAHIQERKTILPLPELTARIKDSPPPRGFVRALKNKTPALIAEVKKASPSKGIIRADFNPADIARAYEQGGATCLSVLTDEPYFQGKDEYLPAVKNAVSLPVLRKDFMLDEYQIIESRALGADCILLIMAALTDDAAAHLYKTATSLGMDSLIEIHDEDELRRALKLSPALIGVNNRSLKTLNVDLKTGHTLGKKIPDGILKVAESGIDTNADIQSFQSAGYTAFLVGESLMKQPDITAATRTLLGQG